MAQCAPAARLAAGSPLLSREQAKALADRVLKLSTRRPDARQHHEHSGAATPALPMRASRRLAVSPTRTVTVTVAIGKRQASASTNVLDDASLKRTVDLATRLARLSPEDPELMPELGPQTYPTT